MRFKARRQHHETEEIVTLSDLRLTQEALGSRKEVPPVRRDDRAAPFPGDAQNLAVARVLAQSGLREHQNSFLGELPRNLPYISVDQESIWRHGLAPSVAFRADRRLRLKHLRAQPAHARR